MKKKTTSKAKGTSKRGKNIRKLSQAHGKLEAPETKFQPTTLDQVWGDDGLWRYKTHDVNEYEGQLDEMTKQDLYAHATKSGLIPVENRELLKSRLMREFRRHEASYTKPRTIDTSVEVSSKVRKILSEGK
jgi:hypothetical protein